jgi:hypothetical protein
MTNTLFLFLFTPQVDSYVNAIAYTRNSRDMRIDAVKLLYVKGAQTGLTDEKASELSNGIWLRIENLREKSDVYREINESLLSRQLIPIEYSDLKNSFDKLIKEQGNAGSCIVDITGATKVPSIDVFSICLSLGINSVYTFELLKERNVKADDYDPMNFLYHSLCKGDYLYTCVSETEPVKQSQSSILRKSSLFWYVGVFSLFIMVISLYLIVTLGSENMFIQVLNIAAAIAGLVSPILALSEQRNKRM